jgi:large subunit ribosomal protein L17
MRHRVRGRKLGRTTAHRKALFRNQLTALFTHERIITTLAKAKELRPMAERMVTLAGTGSLPARRKVLTMVPDKVIVRRLFDEIAPRFIDRPGGYTRVMRLGRRHGDGAEMAIIEFVDYDLAEHEEGGSSSKDKGSLMDRAKGLFGGGAKAAAEETVEEIEETTAAEDEAEDVVETAAEPEPEPEAETTAKTAPADAEEPEPVETASEEPAAEPEKPAEAEAIDEIKAEETEAPPDEPAEEPEAAEAAAGSEVEEEKKD